jgi:PEGA domain
MMLFRAFAVGSLLLIATSCGTIANGTTQCVSFTSSPSGAYVFVDEQYVGETPLATKLSRRRAHQISIELDGYDPYCMCLRRRMSPWVLANAGGMAAVWGPVVFDGGPWSALGLAYFLYGTALTTGVDLISGGFYEFRQDRLHADFSQTDPTSCRLP